MIHSSARDSITVQTEQVLIEKYDRLYRLAYSYVYNEDDALDIVQESACKAICQCNSLKDPSKLYSWICRIVVNTTMDLLRSSKKRRSAWRASRTGIGRCLPGNRFQKMP